MQLVDRTRSQAGEKPARSLVFDKILVAVGTAENSSRATDAALTLARMARGDVLVVYAFDVQICCAGDAEDHSGTLVGLDEVVSRFRAAGATCEGLVWRSVNRSIADGLISAAVEYQPSLVVLPDDRPHGLRRLARQSICEAVGRRAGCAVLVVP